MNHESEKDKKERQESEANAFALALLMPNERFLRELHKRDIDLSDENDNRLQEIAKTFQVSLNAVVARISMLRLLTSKK